MSLPRLLVIGRTGQLAEALVRHPRADGWEVTLSGRPEADLTVPASLERLVDTAAPDVILNAGAFTAVDRAESAADEAFTVNRDGPAVLAALADARDVPLIQISTDCVFDGKLARPYRPDDPAHPLSVYGRSKLAGEAAVASRLRAHLIVRVSWIFSTYGSNFVRTMLALAERGRPVTVVDDQIGCPTHALDLAGGLLEIAARAREPGFGAWGMYHLAGQGETDRASMARAIFEDSRAAGGPAVPVTGVPTSAYPTPARRPLNARLDSTRVEEVFGVRLPHWRARLRETVGELVRERKSA